MKNGADSAQSPATQAHPGKRSAPVNGPNNGGAAIGVADVDKLVADALARIAAAGTPEQLEKTRLNLIGRKGVLPLALRAIKDRSAEDKRRLGPALNQARTTVEAAVRQRALSLSKSVFESLVDDEAIDVTEPLPRTALGHIHPTEHVRREVEDIFRSMGFEVVRGQEIDDEENNFDLLNIPASHPARDLWDTFWLKKPEAFKESSVAATKNRLLLRTHTSNMQVRVMRDRTPPLRIVNIGRVYRYESTDKTHETTFNQIEGFIVDESTTLGDLRGTLHTLFETIFGQKLVTRLRPSYFPFTEPSVELDMSCTFCKGKGCAVCKNTGWLEIGGAGMIHPNVLKNGGLNPNKFQGFAFGMGLERITMFKYGIDDIRWLLSADLRFLEQF
ncbi:MAG: phenylalanine--tRNA ligase subunit alpha [bacterium]|nr:phenylalanine--tRNA ligase subunit alpha [bacterium]